MAAATSAQVLHGVHTAAAVRKNGPAPQLDICAYNIAMVFAFNLCFCAFAFFVLCSCYVLLLLQFSSNEQPCMFVLEQCSGREPKLEHLYG